MTMHIFKNFRIKNRMTQLELGLRLGLDPSVAQTRISHYESGRRELPVDLAYAFIDMANTCGELDSDTALSLEDVYPRPAIDAA